MKIQGQGHSSRSQSRHNTLSTHIPFVPCRSTLPFLGYSNFKFDDENSRSRSSVRSKLKVITWVLHSVDSHPFRSMSIGHPVPELWLFQNLTLKIKGQGHGWGHSSKSQGGSNILSTHIPFVPCQSGIPLLSQDFFKIWPWNSRVKVMGEVTVQSHNVGLTSYIDSHPFRSMSIGPPISDIQHFQNLTLKIKGQGHGWGNNSKSKCGSNILSIHIPFVPCQSALPFLSYHFFSKFDLEIERSRLWVRSQFKVTMWV